MAGETKQWFKSKTLWANVLVVAIGVLTGIQADMTAGLTISGTGLVNILLRVISKTALGK